MMSLHKFSCLHPFSKALGTIMYHSNSVKNAVNYLLLEEDWMLMVIKWWHGENHTDTIHLRPSIPKTLHWAGFEPFFLSSWSYLWSLDATFFSWTSKQYRRKIMSHFKVIKYQSLGRVVISWWWDTTFLSRQLKNPVMARCTSDEEN